MWSQSSTPPDSSETNTLEVLRPVLALEVGVSLGTYQSVSESEVSQRMTVRWYRPSRMDARAPSGTLSLEAQGCRVGTREERPAQVRQGLGRSPEGALSSPTPSLRLPHESESSRAPRRSRIWGAGLARTWELAPGTGGAMDGLGRRLRASLRLNRGQRG